MTESRLEKALAQYDDADWAGIVAELLPWIHEVDRTATQIWFKFYPIDLLRALNQSEDPAKLAAQLLLKGNFYLKDQIDSSHTFLYGHRYWPAVKKAVEKHAESDGDPTDDLAKEIREIADQVASELKVDPSLVVGIVAVGLMTLAHTGDDAFKAARGEVKIDEKYARRSPEQVMRDRARDDKQGMLGFLKTIDKEWTVTFDENDDKARYRMKHLTDLAYGAAADSSRDWRAVDPRCIEGPIPVECRSASCGTCWVGVLGGAEKLSDVVARLEGKQVKEFGYIDTNEPKPIIRLACQAQATGAVSIVIPPWNGVFGKHLQEQESEQNSPDEVKFDSA